ncbi:hypothetical protein K7X08_022858 [Anisodus acutangulus]|uniref:DUF3444 domain-containing protein n=1 Tax=Anisodus acutangulus TaxID=402998 RepID=A0A9Q1RH28_9SOLA|nr:hypothetical protein K7X08_022858 [Anisodus acutangulus]
MVLLKRISDVLEEIECKKVGIHRSLFTLMLEWKCFEQHLDLTETCFKECFNELESREKHLCSIQESIGKSSKELQSVRESLNAKREEIEDKEREFLEYVDLKLREEKLYEKEMSVRSKYEELENVIEGKLKEIDLKEKQFQERAYELDSREEKLKQQETELKARQEELDSSLLFNKMKLDSTKELAESSSQLSPRACDSSERSRKRERTTMLAECKRPKAGKSSEYGKEERTIGMAVDDKNLTVQQLNTDNAGLAIICSDNIVCDDSEPESDTDHEGTIQVWDCPRATFHDFDKENKRGNFDVDQLWACYDDLDGMPRLYARVEKVFTPDKLEMVWLEADAEENHWTNHELQVSCGRFRLGSSLDVSNHLIFSHQMQCKTDVQGYYLIYPMKGETWAVWSSELLEEDHHRQFKYEIVEVLSDFVEDVGIRVCYLDKVSGYVSIFGRRCGSDSFVIPANELRRFSHKVPSFKLTQSMKECFVEECFELDPASLPNYPDNARYDDKVKVEYEEVDDVYTFK